MRKFWKIFQKLGVKVKIYGDEIDILKTQIGLLWNFKKIWGQIEIFKSWKRLHSKGDTWPTNLFFFFFFLFLSFFLFFSLSPPSRSFFFLFLSLSFSLAHFDLTETRPCCHYFALCIRRLRSEGGETSNPSSPEAQTLAFGWAMGKADVSCCGSASFGHFLRRSRAVSWPAQSHLHNGVLIFRRKWPDC